MTDFNPDEELVKLNKLRNAEKKKTIKRKERKEKRKAMPPGNLQSILGSKHMMANLQDKQIFNALYLSFSEELKEKKGSVKPSDELLLHQLCWAIIRLWIE